MYNTNESIEAQKKYCEEHEAPHFAPNTGRCWNCNQNIYQPIGWKYENGRGIRVAADSPDCNHITGITIEKAGKELVTGCPHCNRSYCD
ncbi:hypothetical protein NYE54_09120 [Paenibacillus sp. FSL K6-1330]|uniref:hypothetical protein n=1 Tax=Paenibacillus sp. FSL K6-1330 TaxID=2975292 RepID=UPI0030D7F996